MQPDRVHPKFEQVEVVTAPHTSARVILASANPYSTPENPIPNVGTLLLTYPRFIHSELMTYREWSRNAASSRAISLAKSIEQVSADPAIPVYFTGRKKGMGGDEDPAIIGDVAFQQARREAWIQQSKSAVAYARSEEAEGASKQEINRALEPYMVMQTIVTATAWRNMLRQRLSPSAQPDFRRLAQAIGIVLSKVSPVLLGINDWHLPYVTGEADEAEILARPLIDRLCISAGRLGRVSFYQRGVVEDVFADLVRGKTHQQNRHLSPWEHAASPVSEPVKYHGNLTGWLQARRYLNPGTEAGDGPYNAHEDCELIGDVIKNGW